MRTKISSVNTVETIVSIDEAMEHSRITDTYDELVVQATLDAATDLVEKWLNRKLYPTVMIGAIPEYRQKVLLSYPPVHGVSQVTAEDEDGVLTTFVQGTDYVFDVITEQVIFRIKPLRALYNFKFYFNVGYACADNIPMGIKHAIKQTFATLYENREDTIIGASISEVPLKSIILLKPYRVKAVS